jgi:four helix bundle protein
MERTGFENLRVYQLAEQLGDEVWRIVLKWEFFAKRTIGEQLVDAADSIGANIAEGAGRATYRENHRFGVIARGSLYETKHFLRRAFRRNLITAEDVAILKPIPGELSPRLNAYLKSLLRRSSKPRCWLKSPEPQPTAEPEQQLSTNH